MEMRFLDASNAGISSVLRDLRTEQSNDGIWRQHTLVGAAPPNTASVLVTAYAVDMIPNIDPGQSAFFDDFSLVPEPNSLATIWMGTVGICLVGRRHFRPHRGLGPVDLIDSPQCHVSAAGR
jgi:hypothetical protein